METQFWTILILGAAVVTITLSRVAHRTPKTWREALGLVLAGIFTLWGGVLALTFIAYFSTFGKGAF
jgi:uncharacterized BrkB/YihY/UPF0761 family membrane protein